MKRRIKSLEELEKLRNEIKAKKDPNKPTIAICVGSGCIALGVPEIVKALKNDITRRNLIEKVEIRETGCLGSCEEGPMAIIYPEEICYFRIKTEDASEIIEKTIIGKKIIERLLYKDPNTGRTVKNLKDIPFYKYQLRPLLEKNALFDPKKIEDYIAQGGYSALTKCLFKMKPEDIISEIKTSNLRGRGGGGFPTGTKWQTTKEAPEDPKYVIVNCDEGDPGAFMDRALMEGNPHSILEGLIIGAIAIGSQQGFIYVREEYPLALENISLAVRQAEGLGFLGKNILGSEFSFNVRIHRGAGAFVSGESSALMTAIEGKVGEPRPKYVHTAVKGIWNRPSCLNNVETWANVPLIILNGAKWFRGIGTKGSSGTKIFSLVGKVKNTGLVEVPMGITLQDLVYKIGGGIKEDKEFKAIQTGGPSGGFIPKKYLKLPVDFDELDKIGSMMGSGGMVVMDEDTCMVDVAKYFVDFLLEESCGKCIPCRDGLKVLSSILDDICRGGGKKEDTQIINDLSETIKEASLCALGSTAANPVLTSLEYFKDEWEQHIKEKKCPAKACKALINYYIEPKKCQACLLCLKECPVNAIHGDKDQVHWIEQEKCTKCGACYDICNFNAVERISGRPVPPLPPNGTKPIRKKGK